MNEKTIHTGRTHRQRSSNAIVYAGALPAINLRMRTKQCRNEEKHVSD